MLQLMIVRRASDRKFGYLLATLALCLTLGACASSSTVSGPRATEREASASAVQHPMLVGIPLPSGFQMVEDRSYGRMSGQLRYASCEFEGNLSPTSVNRFYKEYMSSAGFTLRQERFDRGLYVMDFDSSAEQSTVRIARRKFKTVLTIDVGPTPKGSAERDASPPIRRP
ncbi:MAG: hypothetical protein ABIG44_06605 [Planctomycetota bacterium]